jgi:ABC-type transporter Mla subunit MlaD
MADPKDTLNNLVGSKDQLAQVSQIANGITSGAMPPSEAFKIPDQVSAAQGMLDGLQGSAEVDNAKDALDNASKAASALKDEAMQKMPEPVGQAKDALTGMGQEVVAAGAPIQGISASLPDLSAPIGDAGGTLGDLQNQVPSVESLQSSIPNVQDQLAPLQQQIPDLASQLDPPSQAIEGLTGKLKDVLGGVRPMIDAPPLSQALEKAGTTDLVKEHLDAAEEKLPQVPPLLDQAKAKLNDAVPPLTDAGAKLSELQSAAMASVPPPPNASLDDLKQQINDAAAGVNQAADPVNAAVQGLPSAQDKVGQAQSLIGKASDQMKPAELKQSMDQIGKLISDAQKQVATPAAGMTASADAVGPLQNQLSSIKDSGSATLPGAAAAVPPDQQANAAELLGRAQGALESVPKPMTDAAPAVQQLADKLPQVSSPLAQAVQTMNDALTPQQKDLAELERLLNQAQQQMATQTQQVTDASKQTDDSQKKVTSAAGATDPAALKKMLDEITSGLPQLDDQTISDLEKKLPDFEALLDRIEKSEGGAQ